MDTDFKFERNQLLALAWVILLSPALRLFPAESAELAGRGAWLSALLAAAPLALYVFFLSRFMECRADSEGMGELILRALGGRMGKPVLTLFALWFTLYAGFVLRSGAERFITTVYPNSSSAVFSVVLGVIALIAALSPPRSLVRVAKMVLPLVLGVMLLVLLSALGSVDGSNILPLSDADAVPVFWGILPAVDVIAAVLYIVCFLEGPSRKKAGRFRAYLVWASLACLMLSFISFDLMGAFGPELTARLTRPFFSLVRNLVFFRTLERIEALVVSLWVFPDFLMVALLLYSSQLCLHIAWCEESQYSGEKFFGPRRGRYLVWLCASAAIVCSLLIGRDSAAMSRWSERIIPLVNMSFAFVVLPVIFIVGKIKKRL